jgi:hypothetical protein
MAVKLITLYRPEGPVEFSNVKEFALRDWTLRFTTHPDHFDGTQAKYATNLPFLIELDEKEEV